MGGVFLEIYSFIRKHFIVTLNLKNIWSFSLNIPATIVFYSVVKLTIIKVISCRNNFIRKYSVRIVPPVTQ